MWILMNDGFLSIVAKDRKGLPSHDGPDAEVSVRFRRRKDAKAIFPKRSVVATPGGDYGFRVFATRAEVAEVVSARILGVGYTNFKSSIKDDLPLSSVAHAAWSVFGRLQDGGPYGGARFGARHNPPLPLGPKTRVVDGIPRKRRGKAKAVEVEAAEVVDLQPTLFGSGEGYCVACGLHYGADRLSENGVCPHCLAWPEEEEAATHD